MKVVLRGTIFLAIGVEFILVLLAALAKVVIPLWVMLIPLLLIGFFLVTLITTLVSSFLATRSWVDAITQTAQKLGVPRLALAMLVSEVMTLLSLLPAFGSRHEAAQKDADRRFSYHQTLRIVIIFLVGLSAVEVVVVHFAVAALLWRLVLLVGGLYALALLLGFYRSLKLQPHLLTNQGIILRHGKRLCCVIAWEQVQDCVPCTPGADGSIKLDQQSGKVRIPVLSQVNMRLMLQEQAVVSDLFLGHLQVSEIEFFADQRQDFLSAVEEYLAK